MTKKLLLGLGTVASLTLPIIGVVSCSGESHTLLTEESIKKILSKYIEKDITATIEISGRGCPTFQIVIKIYNLKEGKLTQQLNFDGETDADYNMYEKSQDVLRNKIEKIWDDLMKEKS